MADDEGGLSVPGLLARMKREGATPIQIGADRPRWTFETRERDVISIRNPIELTPAQRLQVWKDVETRINPFGKTH